MCYNLLEKKWIPVLYRNGQFDRVGIKDALIKAGQIREIAASNPMDRFAVMRFLLAILYWCKGNPPDETNIDSFPAEWFSKLEETENRDCFNLLGNGKRFYQDADARRSRPTTDLYQEIPTGHNFWHFKHTTDFQEGLCASCCAIGLLRLPLFMTFGGNTKPYLYPGINGVPPVYIMSVGNSLFETLHKNWIPRAIPFGEPSWIDLNFNVGDTAEIPLLKGLTMLARKVWLAETESHQTCYNCGVKSDTIIRRCEFQSPGKQETALWRDPHALYLSSTSQKSIKAPDPVSAGKFKMDRPLWKLLAPVIEAAKTIYPTSTTFAIIGLGTDNAKYVDVWERIVELPSNNSVPEAAVSTVEQWQKETSNNEFVKRLPKTMRVKRKLDHLKATYDSNRPHVEHAVSTAVGNLLSGGETEWQNAASEYRPMQEMIAKSLAPGATLTATIRRKSIANALPDMRAKHDPPEKTKRRKSATE